MPFPDAIALAVQFRKQLASQESAAIERMARVYSRLIRSLQNDIQILANEIAEMDELSLPKVKKLARMQQILTEVQDIGQTFGATIQSETQVVISQSIDQGIQDAIRMIDASLPPLPDPVRVEIIGSLARVPVDAVETIVGLGIDDGALKNRLLKTLGDELADQVGDHILDGIVRGMNPQTIARSVIKNFGDRMGQPLAWATNTVRTAQIKSYQIANHSQFLENNRLTPEWIWFAHRDDTTCLSCIANHGKSFPVTEILNDHHQGRCVPVPKPISYSVLGVNLPDPDYNIETGPEWFQKQPRKTQLKMMGPGKYELWKMGKIQSFDEFIDTYDDDIYGTLIREKSLKQLV